MSNARRDGQIRAAVVIKGQLGTPAWKTRTCPKCDAAPGQSCRITRGGSDGAYSRPIKTPHDERKPPSRTRGTIATITDDEKAEIINAYQRGASVRVIAGRTGWAVVTVGKVVTEAGIMRPKGRNDLGWSGEVR